MDRVYKIFAQKTGNNHLSENIAESIDTYHLGLNTGKYPSDIINLYIGITEDTHLTKGNNFKSFTCQNNIEAVHTKIFFIKKRHLEDDNKIGALSGKETIIYVYSV